ncbi:MAG: cupredoxin domain-containing protein [Rickettsiales bacterium]
MKHLLFVFFIVVLTSCGSSKPVVKKELHIKNHVFSPSIVRAKENEVLKLIVYNDDNTVEEFESFDLKREKIVPAKGKITVTVGPLKKGSYEFFGEFNMETAKGKIIVE